MTAVYGPSQSTTPPSEVTEIFYHNLALNTDAGSDFTIAPFAVHLPAGSDRYNTIAVRVPSTWATFDLVAVLQTEIGATGDAAMRAYYGNSFVLFVPMPSIASVAVDASTFAAGPTATVLATGVPVVGEYGLVNIGRAGTDPSDTCASNACIYGIVLRKAS